MKKLRDPLVTVLILVSSLLISFQMSRFPSAQSMVVMVSVLGVFLVSYVTVGYFYGILAACASVLINNFVFTYPYFAFDFLAADNFMAALVMLIVAVLTSTMTTKLKAQEKARADARTERMRANLLRAISHDLRTPLTTIYGSCSAIQENYDSLNKEQQMKLLGEIQEDSENLIRMVENLLSVTRIGGEGVQLHKTPTVLEELIDTTLVKFRKIYPNQSVEVSIPDDFISIPMDAMLIYQVLINLLENAVIHARGMTKLTLQVYVQDNRAFFEVADNGCGLSSDRKEKLFSGYLDSGDAPADGGRMGMGIGLSVCASIIKAHGGAITGENRPEGGAIFRFWLEMEEEHGK